MNDKQVPVIKETGLEFATVAKTFRIARAEEGEVACGEVLGAMKGAGQRIAAEMTLGGFGQVAVPDIFKGVVEADAFKTVVEADWPTILAGESWKDELGEVFEAGDAFPVGVFARCTGLFGLSVDPCDWN